MAGWVCLPAGIASAVCLLAACGASQPHEEASDVNLQPGEMASGCAPLIALGQLDRYRTLDFDAARPAVELLDAYTSSPRLQAADTLAINRQVVNQCEIVLAHAKGLPDMPGLNQRELIRTLLLEGEGEHRKVVAIGERFLCWHDAEPRWRTDACPSGS